MPSPDELDAALDRAEAQALELGRPQAFELTGPGASGTLSLVVGAPRSTLNHIPADGDPPYLAGVGDQEADRPFTFYVQGEHHSECAWRYTVAPEVARQAARHFLETGELDPAVEWEET